MSPNPNAIAAADAFHLPLTSVMAAGIIPGLFGLVMAYWLAKRLNNRGSKVAADEVVSFDGAKLPGLPPPSVRPWSPSCCWPCVPSPASWWTRSLRCLSAAWSVP
jgi:H+/gluconate symporter-like permease